MTNKDILKSYLLSVLENTDTASGGTEIICKCNMPGCDDTKGVHAVCCGELC